MGKRKKCSVCEVLKPITGFYFRYKSPFDNTKYYRADCKNCHTKAQKLRRKLKNL